MIELFKDGIKRFKDVKNENEYNPTPRVQSTVKPPESGFNEVFQNVHKQLKQKYEFNK